jgi:hypothetical protein
LTLPLLPSQERWLTIERRFPGGTTPLVLMVHRIHGPLNENALARAVSALVNRHDALRARFVDGDQPRQVIGPPNGLELEWIDLSEHADPEEAARELLGRRREIVFDLSGSPSLRAGLVRLADDDHVLTMEVHHILADGMSLAVLEEELGVLYQAFAGGAEPVLPAIPVGYGDYVVGCAAEHEPAREEESVRYWTKQLTGLPNLELRADFSRPAAKGAPAADLAVDLNELAGAVERLAAIAHSTRFMVLLGAVQVALGRWSGQDDFAIGVPVAGADRSTPELARIVAPCNNMLPLRADLSGDPPFSRLLNTVRATVMEAVLHQDLTFGRIVRTLGVTEDSSRVGLCQALFLFDEAPTGGAGFSLPGLRIEGFPLAIPKIPYDLMVHAGLRPGGMWATFFYDTALYTRDTVAAHAEEFRRIVHAVTANPDIRLSELS